MCFVIFTSGGTSRAVTAWMGHSTIRVTFGRYVHLFPHELGDLAANLARLRADPDAFRAASLEHATVTRIERRDRAAGTGTT